MLATLFEKPMNMSLEKKNLKEDFAVCVAYVASLFLREFDEKVGTRAEKRNDKSTGNARYVVVATKQGHPTTIFGKISVRKTI